MAQDEALSDAERAYEVNVHNTILESYQGNPQKIYDTWLSLLLPFPIMRSKTSVIKFDSRKI